MSVKRSAREIKEMEFAQKNADEAIKRHMDENLELLKLMRKTIEKLGEVQTENASLITTIESQNSQIESLKAITELAVQTLNDVINEDFTFPPGRSRFIRDRLLEIERLGGDQN